MLYYITVFYHFFYLAQIIVQSLKVKKYSLSTYFVQQLILLILVFLRFQSAENLSLFSLPQPPKSHQFFRCFIAEYLPYFLHLKLFVYLILNRLTYYLQSKILL